MGTMCGAGNWDEAQGDRDPAPGVSPFSHLIFLCVLIRGGIFLKPVSFAFFLLQNPVDYLMLF